MLVIDETMALDALQNVVNEAGEDYRVDVCEYTTEGPEGNSIPSCIVGRALHSLGVDIDVLFDMDRELYSREYTGSSLTHIERDKLPFQMTDEAYAIFVEAQRTQDMQDRFTGARGTWGEAMQNARIKSDRFH